MVMLWLNHDEIKVRQRKNRSRIKTKLKQNWVIGQKVLLLMPMELVKY